MLASIHVEVIQEIQLRYEAMSLRNVRSKMKQCRCASFITFINHEPPNDTQSEVQSEERSKLRTFLQSDLQA